MSKRLKNPVTSWHYDLASTDTMSIPCFKKAFYRLIPEEAVIADLFARNCQLGTPGLRNDIDIDTAADFHLDVFKFLEMTQPASLDAVIIDPPFSFNQASKHYKNSAGKCLGVGWVSAVRRSAAEKLKIGGLMFCLGWDANGAGNINQFDLIEVIICAHGQARSATIMTIDRRIS